MPQIVAEIPNQPELPLAGDLDPQADEVRRFRNMLTVICPKDAAGRAALLSIMKAIAAASSAEPSS